MPDYVKYTVSYKHPGSSKLRYWVVHVPNVGTPEDQALEASNMVRAKVSGVAEMVGWQEYGLTRHPEED